VEYFLGWTNPIGKEFLSQKQKDETAKNSSGENVARVGSDLAYVYPASTRGRAGRCAKPASGDLKNGIVLSPPWSLHFHFIVQLLSDECLAKRRGDRNLAGRDI